MEIVYDDANTASQQGRVLTKRDTSRVWMRGLSPLARWRGHAHTAALISCMIASVVVTSTAALVPPRVVSWQSLAGLAPLAPHPYSSSSWTMTSTCCGYGPFSAAAVANASAHYGLFDAPCLWTDLPSVAEWGYEFHNNQNHIFNDCGNLTMAGYASPPVDRDDALARLKLYWDCRAADARRSAGAGPDAAVWSETGHYLYAGLSSSFDQGVVWPGSEVGENINSINLHIAFNRGTARRTSTPFLMDVSCWMQGFITDYSATRFWGSASSPVGGHSLSLYKRVYLALFMSGSSALVAEAGAVNWFLENTTSAGVFELSPLGAVGQGVYAFSHNASAGGAEGVRGVPYVPIAVVVAQTHGMGIGYFYNGLAWDVFPMSDGDRRANAWLASLWYNSFTTMREFGGPWSEKGYMVDGSVWGDFADVMTPANLTGAGLLKSAYRATVLAGVTPSPQLAQEVVTYVSGGGTVVFTITDVLPVLASFPAGFLGLLAKAVTSVVATGLTDVETGWQGPVMSCVTVAATAGGPATYYIRTGGGPSISGWDGGVSDKCCGKDGGDCYWFGSLGQCQAALVNPQCVACGSGGSGVGCPAWPTASAPSAISVALASLSTATPVIVAHTSAGDVPIVTANSYGQGSVVVILAGGVRGDALGPATLVPHLLDRLGNDTAAVAVTTNSTTGSGVQVLTNRTPGGWVVTLINNDGVVKQPGTAESVDSAQDKLVTVTLRPSAVGGGAPIASAWVSKGDASPYAPLTVMGGLSVQLPVPAGDARIVTLTLAGQAAL